MGRIMLAALCFALSSLVNARHGHFPMMPMWGGPFGQMFPPPPPLPFFQSLQMSPVDSEASSSNSNSNSNVHATFVKSGDEPGWQGAVSMSSNNVHSSCNNKKCKAKINGRTYRNNDGSYARSMIKDNCSPAFSPSSCHFVTGEDGCPVGKCQGFGTREACKSNTECKYRSDGTCTNGICKYPEPNGQEVTPCFNTNECSEAEECKNRLCVPSTRKHPAGGPTCVFDIHCPSGYFCDHSQMTCFEGPRKHSQTMCMTDDECDPGQSCNFFTCQTNNQRHRKH